MVDKVEGNCYYRTVANVPVSAGVKYQDPKTILKSQIVDDQYYLKNEDKYVLLPHNPPPLDAIGLGSDSKPWQSEWQVSAPIAAEQVQCFQHPHQAVLQDGSRQSQDAVPASDRLSVAATEKLSPPNEGSPA